MRLAKKQKVEGRPPEWEAADAVLWDPVSLVGKQLRVFWPKEDRYFRGTIVKYLPSTFEHEIHYDDGDEEVVILANEKIQLWSGCVLTLSPPSPSHLSALARHLDSLADELEVKAVQQRTARGRTMLKGEDRTKLELLRRRSADVRNAKDRLEALLKPVPNGEQQEQSVPAGRGRSSVRNGTEPSQTQPSGGQFSPGRRSAVHRDLSSPARNGRRGTPGLPRATSVGVSPVAPTRVARQDNRSAAAPGESGMACRDLSAASPSCCQRQPQRGAQEISQQKRPADAQPRICGPQECALEALPPVVALHASPSRAAASCEAKIPSLDDVLPDQPDHLGISAWTAKGRNTRAADANLGPLYVPSPWLVMRATAEPARLEMQAVAPRDEAGAQQQRPQLGTGRASSEDGGGEEQVGDGEARDGTAGTTDGSAVALDGGSDRRRDPCGSGKPVADDASRRSAEELRDAYKHFRRYCSGFKQYHELQVALWLSPQQLVGREIRVLWPDEQAWFCGRVTHFDVDKGTHTVEYDDGDVEHLHLAAEEVRLQVVPGEAEAGLAPRPPAELRQVAACMEADAARLRQRGKNLQQNKKQQQARRKQGPAKQMTGVEAGPDEEEDKGEEDPEELLVKAERLATRASQLRSLAAILARDASSCPPVSEEPVPPPSQVQPPQQPTQELTVLATTAEAAAAAPSDSGDNGAPAQAGPMDITNSLSAGGTKSAALGAAEGSELPAPPQQKALDDCASEVAGTERAGSAEVGQAHGVANEPALAANWADIQVLQPGEVVWAQVRRATPWPAIIITREEAEREGLNVSRTGALTGKLAQFVFVRFFGDHTVCSLPALHAGQRVPDRGGVLPFLPGLDKGWHVRGGGASAGAGAVGGGQQAATGALSGHSQRFLRALFELRSYTKDGELPRGMIPPNYDDDDDDDNEEDEEQERGAKAGAQPGGYGAGAGRKAGAGVAVAAAAGGTVTLPFVVGPKLQVLRLGEVVWLSRWFHDEKYIYPLGYRAVRMMASGASGGKEVPHLMEVTASEDGVRPVFRITPEGFAPVSADSASRAMRALFQNDERASGRAFAKTGADLYGLANPRVAHLVRALPGVERCELFANWPADQERPAVPPLTAFEEVQRKALYARPLRLPAGVTMLPQTKPGMCFECEVCGEDEECGDDLKLECDMCRCVVHARCYGVQQPPLGGMWLCDVCQLHAAGLPRNMAPPCELCPVAGGPMKRTEGGGYVHLLCAIWTPGVTFGDPVLLEPVEGVAKVVQARQSLRCCLCKQAHGACIQCAGDARCYTAFHPMCAREAGMAMCELRQGGRGGDATTSGPSNAVKHQQHQAKQHQRARLVRTGSGAASDAEAGSSTAGLGESCSGGAASESEPEGGKENLPLSANGPASMPPGGGPPAAGSSDVEVSVGKPPCAGAAAAVEAVRVGSIIEPNGEAAAAAAAAALLLTRRRGRPPRAPRPVSGAPVSALDRISDRLQRNGMWLACFCSRHEDLVLHHQDRFSTSFPGGRFAERRAELTREQLRARRQQMLEEQEVKQQLEQGEAHPGGTLAWRADSSMVVADTAAGAMQQPQDSLEPEQATGRAMSFADWRSRGHRAPEAVAIAKEKRTYVRQVPYLVTGRLQRDDAAMQAVREACRVLPLPEEPPDQDSDQEAEAEGPRAAAPIASGWPVEQPTSDRAIAATAAAVYSGDKGAETWMGARREAVEGSGRDGLGSTLPPELATAAAAAGARSVAERYAAMRATVSRRLAVGKSAIHGWGAFAKVPHKRGDMVIEYVGELIRPTLSDVREKRVYDTLVGCGTYIFNLNEHQHIDATRAGNMAHLLNHSCEPNCYSRTITLWDRATGTTRDHVIIIAKRDIQSWEELTYDYRFNSTVDLPCNCGAPSCRLLVNWPEKPGEDGDDEEHEALCRAEGGGD